MISAAGLVLADRHRAQQGGIGRLTMAQVMRVWPLLVGGGVTPASTARWIEVVTALLVAPRERSAALGGAFATQFRYLESGEVFEPRPALTLPTEAVRTSLSVLGPTAYRREVARQLGKPSSEVTPIEMRDVRLPQGLQMKLAANTARASMRHVTNGARDTLDDVVARDRRVVGWMRLTQANPCWFCAMLASRGPVYEGDSFDESDPRFTGKGNHKVHDGCGCMVVPMYRGKQSGDERAMIERFREFESLWKKHPNPLEFRQAYENRLPDPD